MFWWWTFGEVPEVSCQSIHSFLHNQEQNEIPVAEEFLMIDVRTEGEFEQGHISCDNIRNCSFLPPWSFRHRMEEIVKDLPKDRLILLV